MKYVVRKCSDVSGVNVKNTFSLFLREFSGTLIKCSLFLHQFNRKHSNQGNKQENP